MLANEAALVYIFTAAVFVHVAPLLVVLYTTPLLPEALKKAVTYAVAPSIPSILDIV